MNVGWVDGRKPLNSGFEHLTNHVLVGFGFFQTALQSKGFANKPISKAVAPSCKLGRKVELAL